MVSFKCAVFALAAAAALLSTADATPVGAGGCEAGNLLQDSAAGAAHRSRPVTTGALSVAGFQVSIDGQEVSPGTPATVAAGIPHVVTLSATSDVSFRGFLIRLEDQAGVLDTTTSLSPLPASLGSPSVAQVLGLCTDGEGVGGVTHVNNDERMMVSALMSFEFGESNSTIPLTMDVTMVVQNRDTSSVWYYDPFTVNLVTPDIGNAPCPICGDGELADSSVDKIITLDNFPPLITQPTNVTCGILDESAKSGIVSDVLCPNFQQAISVECPCAGDETSTFSPTVTPGNPPTTGPPTAPTPTDAPSGAALFSAQGVILSLVALGVAVFL